MAKRSITRRWFVNSFSFIAALLLIIDVGVFFSLQNYYYSKTEQYLLTEANIIQGVLMYMDEYTSAIRRTVEEFDRKSRMELMVVTADGNIDISSSGFSPRDNLNYDDYDMPDYKLAQASLENEGDGIGIYIGYLPSAEHYIAVTVMLSKSDSKSSQGYSGQSYSAIRVVASLEKIDMQIYSTTLFTGFISIGVLLIMLFLGLYFVKSIVSPLKQVSLTARRLAKGDFSKRIEIPKNDDEISELCQIFNNMADELENSENIKNDFISSVSHELRTPLTAIRGWSETIIETEGQEESQTARKKGLHIILSETSRLAQMVEELLDFSRMQGGRFTLRRANMDVLAELADAVLMYAEKAHREGISLVYNEPDMIGMIHGDKNRIRQVFINIIDNAIKYSTEGSSVIIDAVVGESEKEIEIQVHDSGCGISAADLPKVKNRFFKANNTVRGSGIGLAVAEEIISMHEGKLDIESGLGVGTTVRIRLPLK